MKTPGLILTFIAGGICILGGLLVLFSLAERYDTGRLPKLMLAGIGVYFAGKGIGLMGLGMISATGHVSPRRYDDDDDDRQQSRGR